MERNLCCVDHESRLRKAEQFLSGKTKDEEPLVSPMNETSVKGRSKQATKEELTERRTREQSKTKETKKLVEGGALKIWGNSPRNQGQKALRGRVRRTGSNR